MSPQETKPVPEKQVELSVRDRSVQTSLPTLFAQPGDRISWTGEPGQPFLVHFEDLSPVHKVELRSSTGETVSDTVRQNAVPGVYKYTVVIDADGEIYMDDPRVVIQT